ncbi:MAG: class I SAM-dependent methyltransferase [Deltaproteobacteria bacterium]|nr:class I SAM-dependent methyltransferase [Deltaproteobacteria bacterium]
MQGCGPDAACIEEAHCRCIVCEKYAARFFVHVNGVSYLRCPICRTIYLNPTQRLPPGEEFARYCQHRNNSHDAGYRRKGLDFGCGPGPALACMLREAGHRMRLFDLYFFPDPEPLEDIYDFITCTETIEHLHQPAETFALFDQMLRPGGWLAVMTCFLTDENRFPSWHYRRDPTHVVFYRAATLRHIAGRFGWSCEIPVKDVALMQKPHAQDTNAWCRQQLKNCI